MSDPDTLNTTWSPRMVENLPKISFNQADSSPSLSADQTVAEKVEEQDCGGTEEPESGEVSTLLLDDISYSTLEPIDSHFSKRIQLYGSNGIKLKNNQLFNPKLWRSISSFRPGWVPNRLPFLHADRYWELKASSNVVSTNPPSKHSVSNKVPCGVTCYLHAEGPWCEIQTANGTRICILVAEP